MDNNDKLAIYRAQTENVRASQLAWANLKRSINSDLVKGDQRSATTHTRLLALTYSSWAEGALLKLIHTPYGFDVGEIEQIQASKTVVEAWRKCIELALRRVEATRSGHLANVQQTLDRLVKEFVEKPSLLRNKLAHGQLVIALNRANTAVNSELTAEIASLDVVKLDRLHDALQGLSDIIEAIVESPVKGALRDYWTLLQRVESHLERTKGFTLEDKARQLREKRSRVQITAKQVKQL